MTQSHINELQEMGFDNITVQAVLELCDDNLNNSLDWFFCASRYQTTYGSWIWVIF